ncbi:DUF4142 domain-containing protein [Streptomyces sp. URMC 126]|uniref:DUF4142 domain-containing protein n=1 Tax=Streptomyces sp. URMC 126 TaxID=3423401 RepID=UPI003F1A6CFA
MRNRQRVAVTVAALAISASVAAVAPAGAADSGGVTDSAFLKTVHQGNLAEIESGNDAQTNAVSACVKDTGRMLVRDHGKLDGDVKTLAGRLGVSLPAGPSAEQKQQLASVRAKAGSEEYDAAWLSAQEGNHRKTLSLIDEQISSGRNAQITAAAKAARPVVAMHLDRVSGGTCHAGPSSHAVPAGDGGTAAEDAASGAHDAVTVGATAAGGALLAGALAWVVRRRRAGQEGR